MFHNNELSGETTDDFKEYYRNNIEKIRREKFESLSWNYINDIMYFEYHADTNRSPFVGDEECLHILKLNDILLEELVRKDQEWRASKN